MVKQIWVIIYLDDGPTGFQVFWEKPTVEYRKTMFGAGRYHNNRWCMEPTTEEELKNDFLFFWRSGILSNGKKTYHASINYRIKILRAIKQLKRG